VFVCIITISVDISSVEIYPKSNWEEERGNQGKLLRSRIVPSLSNLPCPVKKKAKTGGKDFAGAIHGI